MFILIAVKKIKLPCSLGSLSPLSYHIFNYSCLFPSGFPLRVDGRRGSHITHPQVIRASIFAPCSSIHSLSAVVCDNMPSPNTMIWLMWMTEVFSPPFSDTVMLFPTLCFLELFSGFSPSLSLAETEQTPPSWGTCKEQSPF